MLAHFPTYLSAALRKTWVRALLVVALASALYLVSAATCNNFKKHDAVYFDYLADAFLQGRLYVLGTPVNYDLTFYGGHWYVPFLPLPAILMLPVTAAFGPNNGLEAGFSALVGGINVMLVYLLLETMRKRGWTKLGQGSNLWLTGLFGLGTVHWYMALDGQVWFLSQITSVTFLALTLLLAVQRASPLWIGACLGLTLWTRPNLILVLPFLIAELVSRDRIPARAQLKKLLMLFVPLALSAAGILSYNWARFADPFDLGYLTENVLPKLASDLRLYGQFNPQFLARNIEIALFRLPQFHLDFPFFTPEAHGEGISLIFITPALLYLIRRAPRQIWMWGAWGAILLLNVPLLLYYNTGWYQFGYRWSLDYIVPAICIVAANAGKKVSPFLAFLIVLSILVNARGVWWWFFATHIY